MKHECEVILDLLPLYHDGVTNQTSADAVEEHLTSCENCRREYDAICTALPEEKNEPSPKKKFLGMVNKQRRLKHIMIAATALAVCVTLIGGYLLQLQFPIVRIPDDEIKAHRVYRYENENGYNYFIMAELPIYGCMNARFESVTVDDNSALTLVAKKPLLSPKWSEDSHNRIFNYQCGWSSGDKGIEYGDFDIVYIGGEIVWSEGDADTPVPEYVYLYDQMERGKSGITGHTYDFEEGFIGFSFEDGSYKVWDLDGNLIEEIPAE